MRHRSIPVVLRQPPSTLVSGAARQLPVVTSLVSDAIHLRVECPNTGTVISPADKLTLLNASDE
jgi:hypothetical protein